ncbi:hypothetical protein ACFRAU_10960 [Arthrobacter sp. NPDC056691]|uniref:hypothetical protein n=1 Tax=Arthrobacter sp. NPDC056691 TaxID=3345913 RepID=UPI00366E10FE
MSGSPVYGAGYQKGSQDGFQEGLGKGTGLGAVGALAVVGTIYLGKLGITKLKDVVAAARHKKKLLAMEQLETPPGDDENDGDDASQGANS